MTKAGVKRPTPRDSRETYATVRQWEVSIPPRMTPQWLELVAILFDRQDVRFRWPTEMIVAALISKVELSGNTEYPGYRYLDLDDGVVKTKVLATARRIAIKNAPVFNPHHWRVSLSPTEAEIDRNPEPLAQFVAKLRKDVDELADLIEARRGELNPDEEVEERFRTMLGELVYFVGDRYGT